MFELWIVFHFLFPQKIQRVSSNHSCAMQMWIYRIFLQNLLVSLLWKVIDIHASLDFKKKVILGNE